MSAEIRLLSGAVSLGDRERLSLAVHGRRIPRQAWAPLHDTRALIEQANTLWQGVHQEAAQLRAKAQADGLAAGQAEAVASMAERMAEAQRAARELMDAQDARVIDLAVALLRRIAPRLDVQAVVEQLALDALRALQAERWLVVRVHPSVRAAVQARLEAWCEAQNRSVSLQVLDDAQSDPLGVSVESEQGSLRAGFDDQLASLHGALQRSLQEVRT